MRKKVILGMIVLLVAGPRQAAPAAPDDLAKRPPVAGALALLDVWVEEQRAWRDLPGVVLGIVHDRQLLWAKGYGTSDLESGAPLTPDTVFRVGSITKLFTSVAILQLRDLGMLRLDDPVRQYLPWFKVQSSFEGEPEVTVRHLLTHTSGLPREAAFPYWTSHEFPSREEIVAALPGQRAVFAPATRYKYSNLGMALLGEIVTALTGETWADYVAGHVLRPLGMTASSALPGDALRGRMTTAYLRRMPDGSRQVAGYYETRGLAPAANMVSTVTDLARFAVFQLGSPDAATVLRPSTVREMQRPHWVKDDWSGGRGLGWSIARQDGKTIVSHGGWVAGHRSHLLLVPAEKIAVIAMTNADDGSPSFFGNRAYELVAPAIAEATAPPPKEKRADPAWKRYVGVYADPWGWEYRVMVLDGELVMYEHGYPPEEDPGAGLTPLAPVAEHTFRMADGELVVFELGDDGKVERVRRRYDYVYPKGEP